MSFIHNSKNIQPSSGKFPVYPEAEYAIVIEDATEGISQGEKTMGFPMITMTCAIIENVSYQGKTFKHWVVFMPEGMDGAGMSVHIRKCLGVPYGGEDEVNASEWIGKRLRVKLKVDNKPFKDKKTGEMRTEPRNKVAMVLPYGMNFPEIVIKKDEKDQEVPF